MTYHRELIYRKGDNVVCFNRHYIGQISEDIYTYDPMKASSIVADDGSYPLKIGEIIGGPSSRCPICGYFFVVPFMISIEGFFRQEVYTKDRTMEEDETLFQHKTIGSYR